MRSRAGVVAVLSQVITLPSQVCRTVGSAYIPAPVRVVEQVIGFPEADAVEIVDGDPTSPDRVPADGCRNYRFETAADLPGGQQHRDPDFRVLPCLMERLFQPPQRLLRLSGAHRCDHYAQLPLGHLMVWPPT